MKGDQMTRSLFPKVVPDDVPYGGGITPPDVPPVEPDDVISSRIPFRQPGGIEIRLIPADSPLFYVAPPYRHQGHINPSLPGLINDIIGMIPEIISLFVFKTCSRRTQRPGGVTTNQGRIPVRVNHIQAVQHHHLDDIKTLFLPFLKIKVSFFTGEF